ncbi:probable inactive tRNA-specific adenosine deaminase-like protein 3 [Oppia nitens]|uniref:probable inactive tRNA-specific adenosine deaminase-like protein 3 n=1 Tax=Oppia nitens TaxID=1686743 RepID=UPI0023DC1A63|nr:probable inactive tRNA-specific adenosine deaminase-like protein 3 [Oppia nitens]
MNAMKLTVDAMKLSLIVSQQYYSSHIETVEVLTSRITDKTLISYIVNFLSKEIPLKSLSHLKRINSKDKSIEVIICAKDYRNSELSEKVNHFLKQNHLLPFNTRVVPKNNPKNRNQYEKSCQLWPINYHPNKYLEKCLNSTVFDLISRKIIFELISKVIEFRDKEDNDRKSMVTLVTDSSHNILTICKSDVLKNPLKHSVIVAIDTIADKQCNERQKDDNIKSDSYLCNGYDFYMSGEPCIMCCMALVHSRISRLFFIDSNDSHCNDLFDCCDKAISLHEFHLLPKLNHHFEII